MASAAQVAKRAQHADLHADVRHREQFLQQRREQKGLVKIDSRRPADFEQSASRLNTRQPAAAAVGGGGGGGGGVELEHAGACQHMLRNVLDADLTVFAAARGEVLSLIEGGASHGRRHFKAATPSILISVHNQFIGSKQGNKSPMAQAGRPSTHGTQPG